MKKYLFVLSVAAGLLPTAVLALSSPTVDPPPDLVDDSVYTFTIHVPVGSTVSVVGGPSNIAPVIDGADGDALDGVVEVMVGLAQNQVNPFSIGASLNGEFSDSIIVNVAEGTIGEATGSSGDRTPPLAPVLDPIQNPVSASEYIITGSTESEANIYVRKPDGTLASSGRATANGIFRVTVKLEAGKTNRFNVSAEDAAYNEGPAAQAVIQVTGAVAPETKTEEVPTVVPFTDIQGHWAESFIEKLYRMGVVSGKTATRFDPDAQMTRAELAKIVVGVFGYTTPKAVSEDPFWDVPKESWFAPYVTVAKQNAIVGGYPDGSFRPNALVDRASALKMLIVAADFNEGIPETSAFKDVEVDDWYAGFVDFARKNGIVSGYPDGTFKPKNPVTRAEAAKMTVNTMDLGK